MKYRLAVVPRLNVTCHQTSSAPAKILNCRSMLQRLRARNCHHVRTVDDLFHRSSQQNALQMRFLDPRP